MAQENTQQNKNGEEIIGIMPLGLIPKESLWKEMAPYLPIGFNLFNEKEKINWLKSEFGIPCFWDVFPIYSNGIKREDIKINYEIKE